MRLHVDPAAGEAVYEQIRRQVAAAITAGALGVGERLPTVRQLAADLGLSTNTVARAYRELERDRLVETRGRKGTFVTSPWQPSTSMEGNEAARRYVDELRRLGLDVKAGIALLRQQDLPSPPDAPT